MGGAKKMNKTVKMTRNKDFNKWTRAESCYRKDNIISTDWHERLERLPLFVPSYAKCRPEMTYIMSMEYGRMWQKEKDEWFSEIFKFTPKEQDMRDRRKKLKKEFLEAKRQAEIKIKERKERLAKEAEAKAKAEAEALEKGKRIKAKLEKCSVKKKEKKRKTKPEKNDQDMHKLESTSSKKDECPEGWKQVELTIQCECAGARESDKKTETEPTKEDEVKLQEPESGKAPEMTCGQDCMPNQIAEAVDRIQKDEAKPENEVQTQTSFS